MDYHPQFNALGRVRLASIEDAFTILDFCNESMAKTFRIEGTADIIQLIESCVLSICQLDDQETVIGFMAFKDHPNIPSVYPSAWEEYLWNRYRAIELTARNTLFLHFLCWDAENYGRTLVDNMLKTVFMHDLYIQYVVMNKTDVKYPALVPGLSRYENSFKRVNAIARGISGDKLPSLYIAQRKDVAPRLKIRRAVEEDNDDIVPMLDRHSKRLRELYGEFYISELISRHPESESKLLVCEDKELAVGVMCLTTQINYEELEQNFQLAPYAGLRHLETKPTTTGVGSGANLMDMASQVNMMGGDSRIGSSYYLEMSAAKDSKYKMSKVVWGDEDEQSESGLEHDIRTLSSVSINILNLLDDDDEEFEFDIVNIDPDLLRKMHMSVESLSHGAPSSIMKIVEINNAETADPGFKEKNKKMNKKAPLAPASFTQWPDTFQYNGTPNAFLLQLCAMENDYDERHAFDMLEAAFELFPDRDYCIMCLPCDHVCFPLLEHFTLVTPFSCRRRFANESLYVAHVNSVRGDVRVRPGERSDIPAVMEILEHAPRMQALRDLFETSLTSIMLEPYVLLNQNQPIGIVVLGPMEDSTGVRITYNLEADPPRTGTDGAILEGVMSPALEPHGRWYLRDIIRQSRYRTLFWVNRTMAKGDASPSRNLMSLGGMMKPVHPRRCIPNLSRNKELEKLYANATPFALWVLERPLTSLPKVNVNNSIVVVGAGRIGLAFIETLIMGPTASYLTFTNITLVSEHGLPTVSECLRAANTCVPNDGRYTDRYIKGVPFYYYVDVIPTVITGIDRQNQCIQLKGGGYKHYNQLVLTCGQQFQHPDYLKDALKIAKELEKGKPCERILMDNPLYQPDRVEMPPDPPENVMLINSLYEANVNLRKLIRMIAEYKDTPNRLSVFNQVVVYGECIEAYSCIAALLEIGLAPTAITFIEPFPPEESTDLRVNCFNDEVVDKRVQQSLEDLGVTVFRQCQLMGWRQNGSRVVTLRIMMPLRAEKLPCFALFYYGKKAININTFKAINECGLVYDGGLVVGPQFETNDPNIFGAGTCVRYSHALYAARTEHRFYSSEAVGEALAQLFLKQLNPFEFANPECSSFSEEMLPSYSSTILGSKPHHIAVSSSVSLLHAKIRKWQPVMKFDSPVIKAATLPGPLFYMKIRKPGPEIPMAAKLSLPYQGHNLVTDFDGNYFSLQVNVLHCIDALTCLSKKPFSHEIFVSLYGKHEALFNKLLTRYEMNLIPDLFAYFTEPWMAIIYQETFQELMQNINEQEVGTVYDLLRLKVTWTREQHISAKSLITTSACDLCDSKDPHHIGTFRSVLDSYLMRKKSRLHGDGDHTDTPDECGQNSNIRQIAADFWKKVGGEDIVLAHLERYHHTHSFINPQYAVPLPEYI